MQADAVRFYITVRKKWYSKLFVGEHDVMVAEGLTAAQAVARAERTPGCSIWTEGGSDANPYTIVAEQSAST